MWSTCTKVQSSSLQNHHRQELGWPTLASRRAASEAMVMHLSVSGHGPSYLTNLFHSVASTHLYEMRSASSGGSQAPNIRQRWERKGSPTEEPKGGIPFQQASEQPKLLSLERTCWPISFDLFVYCLAAWLLAWCDQISFTLYYFILSSHITFFAYVLFPVSVLSTLRSRLLAKGLSYLTQSNLTATKTLRKTFHYYHCIA